MAALVAFASLPFGLRGGEYLVRTSTGEFTVYVSPLEYNPIITITSRPELAQSIPRDGRTEGFTSYTWYDHPFVLRVLFGRNVASLGAISSYATIVQPLEDSLELSDELALRSIRRRFAQRALDALNDLIAVVRKRARLYHVADLRREEIDVTVRDERGSILHEDPLQNTVIEEQRQEGERFDLLGQSDDWYRELNETLGQAEAVTLAQDLLTEAERALTQRFTRQAIVTCHTALETAVSALLTRGMRRRNMPDKQIDYLLSTRNLVSKLDGLLRKYTGFSLKHHNHPLWEGFIVLNDLRNDIAHRGAPASDEDASRAVEVAQNLLQWLEMVQGRNQ